MKFKVFFKTPDAVDTALARMDEEERDKALPLAEQFVEYGECVVIEFDIDEQTATVVRAK